MRHLRVAVAVIALAALAAGFLPVWITIVAVAAALVIGAVGVVAGHRHSGQPFGAYLLGTPARQRLVARCASVGLLIGVGLALGWSIRSNPKAYFGPLMALAFVLAVFAYLFRGRLTFKGKAKKS